MSNQDSSQSLQATTAMLIRKPVATVFAAFVDPAITTKFWFTKSSGRLEAGKQAHWEWEMYNFSVLATVKVVEPNKRIVIEWPGQDRPHTVEWTFDSQAGATFVSITESGFVDGSTLVKQVAESTEGFALVLAGAKAFLEFGIQLHLVRDRFPKLVQ